MPSGIKNILVAGAGALGSGIGGMLGCGGHRVTFLGRPAHMNRVKQNGLNISGIWGAHHATGIQTATDPKQITETQDVVLITVKSFHTKEMIQSIRDLIHPDTLVVSLQNGVGNEEIIEASVGAEQTIGGMVIIGFEVPTPGRVTVTVQADSVKLGRLNGTPSAGADQLAEIFRDASIPCESVTNIRSWLWAKVLYNSALNPLGAILRVPYGKLTAPDSWNVIERLITEAFACLNREGIKTFWKTPDEYLAHLHDTQVPATAAHHASMLQDIRRGSRTEIDFINNAIVRLGDKHAIPVPVNRTLVSIIKSLENNPHSLTEAES